MGVFAGYYSGQNRKIQRPQAVFPVVHIVELEHDFVGTSLELDRHRRHVEALLVPQCLGVLTIDPDFQPIVVSEA